MSKRGKVEQGGSGAVGQAEEHAPTEAVAEALTEAPTRAVADAPSDIPHPASDIPAEPRGDAAIVDAIAKELTRLSGAPTDNSADDSTPPDAASLIAAVAALVDEVIDARDVEVETEEIELAELNGLPPLDLNATEAVLTIAIDLTSETGDEQVAALIKDAAYEFKDRGPVGALSKDEARAEIAQLGNPLDALAEATKVLRQIEESLRAERDRGEALLSKVRSWHRGVDVSVHKALGRINALTDRVNAVE